MLANATALPDADSATPRRAVTSRGGGARVLGVLVAWACAVAATLFAARVGVEARARLWTETASIRFRADVNNALHWGRIVVSLGLREAGLPPDGADRMTWRQFLHGYWRSYEAIYKRAAHDGEYGLDYAPLRMLAMSAWTWHIVSREPGVTSFRDEHARPMLAVNLWVGAASALLGAVLTVLWLRHAHAGRWWFTSPRTVLLSALVGLAVWLNPAGIWNGHAWPQWDTWLVPFFLLAAIAATLGGWTVAGACMVCGAMFKGQILFAFPLLLLWPVFRGQWLAAARFLLGAAGMMLLAGSPWLLQHPVARWYVLLSCVVAALAMFVPWRPTRLTLPTVGLTVLGVLSWPIVVVAPRLLPLTLGVATLVLTVAGLRWRKHAWTVLLLVFATTTLVAAARFDGSWSWYQIGFAYPERNYEAMHMGPAFNLPAILAEGWDWRRESVVFEFDPGRYSLGLLASGPVPVTLKTLLRGLFLVLVAVAAAALARADRRRDARGLLSFALPFLLVFALVPQMHERYLTWSAMLGCLALACSLPASLLLVVVHIAALGQMMLTQLCHDRGFAPGLLRALEGMHPHFGWAVLLAVLSWLFIAGTSTRGASVGRAQDRR